MRFSGEDYFFQVKIMEVKKEVEQHSGFVIGCTAIGYEGPVRAKLGPHDN